jgi:hypothetical protein
MYVILYRAACVCDDRILSASEARAFADLTDPDTLPSVTVALLGDTPQRTVSLLQVSARARAHAYFCFSLKRTLSSRVWMRMYYS